MDLIFYNGGVMTMDKNRSIYSAVGIQGNKIAMVGDDERVLKEKTEDTRIIDLQGRSLLPGFNDSHMHLLNYARVSHMIPLVGVSSIDDIIRLSRDFIGKSQVSEGWIGGRGWNQNLFEEPRLLNRYDLDRIATDRPICFVRACGHVMVVNSYALEMLAITGDTQQVEGGHFDLDESGEPTGIFRENAMGLVYEHMPPPSLERIKEMIIGACEDALKQGITSIQTDDLDTYTDRYIYRILQAYEELNEEGRLPVRIYEQCLLSDIELLREFIDKGYYTGKGDSFFKIGPLKILADGSLGARTAYLSQPYADDPSTCGIGKLTQEELDELVMTAHQQDMQVAIHCIGDAIMEMSMKSFRKALTKKQNDNHRHGIVHSQITTKALIDDFEDMNLLAYIQPIFLDSDIPIIEERVGHERAGYTYNFKTMMNRGIHTPYSSDCPVEPFDVLPGIYSAMSRCTLDGYPQGGWLPKEKVSLEDALYNYTKEGAYASFEEDIKGSIEVGMLADVIVLDEDIMAVGVEDVKGIEVVMTVVDGRIRYEKK